MLVITWLYVIGALGISIASGTSLPRDSRKWWQLVFVLAGGVAVQLLIVNTTAWGVSRQLSIWKFVGAALAYPAGLLLLGAIAFVARPIKRAQRVHLCVGLAVLIYLSSAYFGMLIGCVPDLVCPGLYSEAL